MGTKPLHYLFATIGSTIGAHIPLLWGGRTFSMISILVSGVGGGLGIYVVYKKF